MMPILSSNSPPLFAWVIMRKRTGVWPDPLAEPAGPLSVELGCPSVDTLAELASQSRFLFGHLVVADEHACNATVMIAAGRTLCAV